MNAWDKRDNESNRWYRRFETFLLMGPGRSILGCYNLERAESGKVRTNNIPGSWNKAYNEYEWYKRAEAYDGEQSAQRKKDTEQERERERMAEMEDSATMREIGRSILKKLPIVESKLDKNGNIISVLPANASEYNSARMLLMASSELARLALGMETSYTKSESDITSGGKEISIKVTGNVGPEEL